MRDICCYIVIGFLSLFLMTEKANATSNPGRPLIAVQGQIYICNTDFKSCSPLTFFESASPINFSKKDVLAYSFINYAQNGNMFIYTYNYQTFQCTDMNLNCKVISNLNLDDVLISAIGGEAAPTLAILSNGQLYNNFQRAGIGLTGNGGAQITAAIELPYWTGSWVAVYSIDVNGNLYYNEVSYQMNLYSPDGDPILDTYNLTAEAGGGAVMFKNATGIAVVNGYGNNYIYITHDSQLSICSVPPNDYYMGISCADPTPLQSNALNVILDPNVQNTLDIVYRDHISQCPISLDSGDFSGPCQVVYVNDNITSLGWGAL